MKALTCLAVLLSSWIVEARAGWVELSLGGGYSASKYSETAKNWSRRWNASFGYHFTELSGLEVSFQDIFENNTVTGVQSFNYHDQVYSLNWWQALLPERFFIQPYIKAGLGQLTRVIAGTYENGTSVDSTLSSLSAVVAFGLRVRVHRAVSLSAEISSYVSELRLASLSDKFSISGGIQFRF